MKYFNNNFDKEELILNKDESNSNDFINDNENNDKRKNTKNIAFYRKKPFIFSMIGILSVGLLATVIAVPLSLQNQNSHNDAIRDQAAAAALAKKIDHINTLPIVETKTIWNEYTNQLPYNSKTVQGKIDSLQYAIENFDLFVSDHNKNLKFSVVSAGATINDVTFTDVLLTYLFPSLIKDDKIFVDAGDINSSVNTTPVNSSFFNLDQNFTVAFNLVSKNITPKISFIVPWKVSYTNSATAEATIGIDTSKIKVNLSSQEMNLVLPYVDTFFNKNTTNPDSAPFVIRASYQDGSNLITFCLKPKANKITFNNANTNGNFSTWLSTYLQDKFNDI